MASQWIKVTHELPEKPEVYEMAELLDITPDDVVGKLIRLWSWFDRQTENGNARGVTFARLDRYLSAPGFVSALEKVGWIEKVKGSWQIVHFERHISQSAKDRGLTALRSQKSKTRKGNGGSVTLSSSLSSSTSSSSLSSKKKELSEEQSAILDEWVLKWQAVGLKPAIRAPRNNELVAAFLVAWADDVRREYLVDRRAEVFEAMAEHKVWINATGWFRLPSLFGRIQDGNWFQKLVEAYWPEMMSNRPRNWRATSPQAEWKKEVGRAITGEAGPDELGPDDQLRLEDSR